MRRIIFKIKTKIRRLLTRKLNLHRPSSYPYISGDGFRSLAQHIFDDISNFNPIHVKENDIVFVRTDFVKEFFTEKHPLIRNRYILISHNSDSNIDKSYIQYIDEKIIHWFSQNALVEHLKITPIPIGLTNYHYSFVIDRGNISNIYKAINLTEPSKKINRISYGFVITNKSRVILLEDLKKNRLADNIEDKDQMTYFKKMSSYRFTVSPDGNGADCFRTWEAIYLKTIPFVIRNEMNEYFKKIKLPIYVLDSWRDLEYITEDQLEREYGSIMSESDNSPAFMDYWYKEIIRHKIK
ncbi:MAG: hypothetical protein WCG07_00470 [Candidatus Taylorbacteria bacterium]